MPLFKHYLCDNKKRKLIFKLFICFVLFNIICGAPRKNIEVKEGNRIEKMDEENRQFIKNMRLRALGNIQRSLESYSSLTANSLMLKTALETPESVGDQDEDEDDFILEINSLPTTRGPTTTSPSPLTESQTSKHRHSGLRRIKADLRRIPSSSTSTYEQSNSEEPLNNILTTAPPRKLRSAVNVVAIQQEQQQQNLKNNGGHYSTHHQHHRRRRKGCPSVHGKDQLLCPTKNTYRYDVCITREQLCDRIRDCPGGEDEDTRHCFFFRPLESSLKTLSHAVLLLVDTVMREQEENQHLEQRNEL
uniref:Uncharacterized protein n=1 Tax=Meloidogyne enterolobii TaxID=390850 RepID=A0A6V7U9C3_MELEN|nr:unnamed protein product [Meloidogyne enterolobii]